MEAKQPGEYIESYLKRDPLRDNHRRKQSSQDRISHHISTVREKERQDSQERILHQVIDYGFILEFNKKRPQEETRQPRDYRVTRNYKRRRQGSQDKILHHI